MVAFRKHSPVMEFTKSSSVLFFSYTCLQFHINKMIYLCQKSFIGNTWRSSWNQSRQSWCNGHRLLLINYTIARFALTTFTQTCKVYRHFIPNQFSTLIFPCFEIQFFVSGFGSIKHRYSATDNHTQVSRPPFQFRVSYSRAVKTHNLDFNWSLKHLS